MAEERDWPQELLDSIAQREMCGWCKHPLKPIYRTGLCRHCYDIKKALKRLHREVEVAKRRHLPHPKGGPIPVTLELDYKTAIEMAKSAQCDRRMYGSPNCDDVTTLDLEHEFSTLSRWFLKQDLFHGDAYLFDVFTPSQRRYLMYIISRMSRAYLRRKRRRMATAQVIASSIEDVLQDRAYGTFRVEDD